MKQDLIGPSNKLLEIDLKHRTWSVSRIDPEDRRRFLGGKGLGVKLLYERLEPGIDPLAPANVLAVMPGVLLGTGAPCSGRFHALAEKHAACLAIRLIDFSLYTRLWSSVTGVRISNREFLRAGERIHLLERYMNTREGITRKDDTLPARMLRQGLNSDPHKRTVPLEPMLEAYYREKGYTAGGIPKRSTLQRYGLN